MKKLAAASLVAVLLQAGAALADNKSYSGPFYMCPDAHGEEQKARFKIIDLTDFPMRIEGLGPRRVDGFAADVAESRAMPQAEDPIEKAFERLFTGPGYAPESDSGLVAACFAVEPPPADKTKDGPFIFMPGFFIGDAREVQRPLDTVVIPEQTYLVTTYTGTTEGIGDFRFTMTEEFWPKTAPFLGLERVDAPNLMIWGKGSKGNEPQVTLELWTPIKPFRIAPP